MIELARALKFTTASDATDAVYLLRLLQNLLILNVMLLQNLDTTPNKLITAGGRSMVA